MRVDYHRGHPKNPMTDAEMEEKFRSLARRHLAADRIDALLEQLWALEDMPKAGALVKIDRKSTRLNSSHALTSRMPSSA